MNRQDQQAIDELFQRLYRTTEQGGRRDPEAEARIQQHFQKGPAGLLYHMAQTLVAQQYALQQAKAELDDGRRQGGGASAGFAPPGPQRAGRGGYGGGYGSGGYGGYPPQYQQGYQPQYQQGYPQQQAGSGFLAGAGRIALGVGGGILGAELLSNMFGGGGLFGDRDTYVERDVYVDQDDGGHDDGNRDDGSRDDGDYGPDDDGQDYGGQDYGGQDDYGGGGFDGGGFDGDPGGW